MEIRGVKFRAGSEWRVGGLYYPGGPAPTPAVLMLHGFPGVQQNEDIASELCRRGVTVFLPHFGGCWGSAGTFHIDGLLDDARAAMALLSRYRKVDARRIAALGYSLGGWVALRLASERRLAAVAALAPAVPRDGEVGDINYLRKNGRVVRINSIREVWLEYLRVAGKEHPEQYLPKISPAPVLFVHGGRDRLVLPKSTTRLFDMAREPKNLLEFPEEDHEFQANRRRVINEVCSWLVSRLAKPILTGANRARTATAVRQSAPVSSFSAQGGPSI